MAEIILGSDIPPITDVDLTTFANNTIGGIDVDLLSQLFYGF